MGFQIRFPNGEPIPLETLNAEAANLWNIGIARDAVKYVFPQTPKGTDIGYDEETSWFEIIELGIEYPEVIGGTPVYPRWTDIKESLFNGQVISGSIWDMKAEDIVRDVSRTILFLKPYYELIDLWQSKGYIPIQTKE